jgi:hypothetical protein
MTTAIISPPDSPPSGDGPETPPVPQEAVETLAQSGSSGVETAGGESSTDERRGLPSASSFQRYATCKASIALETQLREAGQLPEDHGSDDADAGTRIHAHLAALATGAPFTPESADENEVALSLWERAQYWIQRVFGHDHTDVEMIVEKRHWLQDLHGNDVASGQFDLILHDGVRGLVIDYKTLFGHHAPAAENRQLRFGAVILREAYGVNEITVVLLQRMRPDSHAVMGEEDMELALEEIDQVLERRSGDPFQFGFTRSEECKFCACRLACPRLHWDVSQLQVSPFALLATATDAQISEFGNRLKSLEHLKRAWESEAEYRIESGRELSGWAMLPGKPRREVSAVKELANRLIARGVPVSDILAEMSLPVGAAERLFKTTTSEKGKKIREAFDLLADGTISLSTPEPSLKQI